jgi:hypothetical protein
MNSSQYPENRLHIVIDENGNVSYRQDPEFLKYYAPTAEELREELEDLEYQLEMKLLDEPVGPFDMFDTEYDDRKDDLSDLRERIRELKETLREKGEE